MQKSLTILLLFTFLFYIAGYRILFIGLQYKADLKMDQKLAADDFQNAPTITLKIPIALPYQFHQTGFQKASGNFEYEGEFFNLVKQKIEGDTLYAVCIKNLHKTELLKKMSGFEKAVNNWPATSNRTYNLFNTFIKDYVPGNATSLSSKQGWTLVFPFLNTCLHLVQRAVSPLSPPPKPTI